LFRKLLFIWVISFLFVATISPILSLGYTSPVNENQIHADSWFDSHWNYRWKVSFLWFYNEELLDYQAVILVPSTFNYSSAQPNGEDIRVTDPNNIELPFFIENWNRGGESRIWVKIPRIRPNSIYDDFVYLYFGNSEASSKSNGTNVFHFFEDFEEQAIGEHPNHWVINQSGFGDLYITDTSRSGNQALYYTDISNSGSPFFYRDLGMDITGFIFEYLVMPDYPTYSGGLIYTMNESSTDNGGNTLFGHLESGYVRCYDGSSFEEVTRLSQEDQWHRVIVKFINQTHYEQMIFLDDFFDHGLGNPPHPFELWGTATSINYIQFWQYTLFTCSLYLDCIRVRDETESRDYPSCMFFDYHFLGIPEPSTPYSQIIGYSSIIIFFMIYISFIMLERIKINKKYFIKTPKKHKFNK